MINNFSYKDFPVTAQADAASTDSVGARANKTLAISDENGAVEVRQRLPWPTPYGVGFVAGNGGVGTKVKSSTVLRLW